MNTQHDAHVQFAIDLGRLDYTVTKSGKVNYFVIPMSHDAHVVAYETYLDSLLPEDPWTGFNYEGDDDFALEEDF